MKSVLAVAELRKLMEQARTDASVQADTASHKAWRAKVTAVLERSLGAESSTTREFQELRYHVGVWSGAPGEAERDAHYFASSVNRAAALIEAAIFELELSNDEQPSASPGGDPELWAHVKHSIEDERWEQVASAVAIFVEHKIRHWAGNPTSSDGTALVGKSLFAKALGPGGALSLGKQASETEGWRNLGTGMVLAVSNVDRHHIQSRPDVKEYALGVLGLGSLLLTQIRHEHPGVSQY